MTRCLTLFGEYLADCRSACLVVEISVGFVGLALYLGAQQRFDPGELVGDDVLGVLGDRLFVSVEGPRGLTECATRSVQPAEYGEASPLEQSYSRRRAEMAGEGQSEREIPRIVACDLGIEQLVEKDLAA